MTNHERHAAVAKFELNPVFQLIEATKLVFSYAVNPALLLIVAPFIIGFINFFYQIITEITVPSSTEKLTTSQTVYSIASFLIFIIFSFGMQFIIGSLSVVVAVAAAHQQKLTIGGAFTELLKKIWRYIGVNIMVFIYALPWMLGIVAIWTFCITLAIANPSTVAVVIPIGVALTLVAIFVIIRVYLRFSLAAIHVYATQDTVMKAMRTSSTLTRERLLEPFGISSIGSLVPFLGPVISPAGLARYYVQIQHADKASLPKPHWLNYLVIIIVGVSLLILSMFIGGIVLLIQLSS